MPCASVSENPTRSRELNLNGGLRSLTRPSSSAIGGDAKRRRRRRVRPVGPAGAEPPRDAPGCEPGEQETEAGERDPDEVGADLNRLVHARRRLPVVALA